MEIKYSVIIPTLNEEYFIKKNLDDVAKLRKDVEIIISDGGSTDATSLVAKEKGAIYSTCEKGRGMQLNHGAALAKGEIFFFLHADTQIPNNAFELLDEFFFNVQNKICRFKLGFDLDNHLLGVYSFFSAFDTIFTRFGDSAIIVRKDFFNSIGGFKNYFIFEDVDFLRRVKKHTNIGLLDAEVKSSARKFIRNGLVRNQILSSILFIKYFLGTKSSTLWEDYFTKMNERSKTSLIIFARYPAKGKVKTRLAKGTSDEFAFEFYRYCSESILNQIKKISQFNKYLFYTELGDKERVMEWAGKKFFYALQEGNNLGSRMLNAIELVFSHYQQKVIIIGTDVPELNSEIIIEADNLLNDSDVVIGPSNDGGYYLLGMKKMYKEFFEDIDWSTNSVFDSTIQKAKQLNLKVVKLKKLRDIDTKHDLMEWLNDGSYTSLKHKIKSLEQTV